MCKDKKWTCVFVPPRRRLHSLRKDQTWTAGLLVVGLPSLSAAEQNPCVKPKSGRAFSLRRGDVYIHCVEIKRGRQVCWLLACSRCRRRSNNPCVNVKRGRVFSFGCGDATFHVDYGLAVVVCGGAQSMCKDKKVTFGFARSRRRPQSMCKAKTWTVGRLICCLTVQFATDRNPCVQIKR